MLIFKLPPIENDGRRVIADRNRAAASGLEIGTVYLFNPEVKANGISTNFSDRLVYDLTFSSGKFLGFSEEPYLGKLQRGTLVFQGTPNQEPLTKLFFYFGIDHMPENVRQPSRGELPEAAPGKIVVGHFGTPRVQRYELLREHLDSQGVDTAGILGVHWELNQFIVELEYSGPRVKYKFQVELNSPPGAFAGEAEQITEKLIAACLTKFGGQGPVSADDLGKKRISSLQILK